MLGIEKPLLLLPVSILREASGNKKRSLSVQGSQLRNLPKHQTSDRRLCILRLSSP
ncbi:hypothetical protein NDA03_03995 [Trichocoleus sp. Lan]|uniref:hypothetical protein n=1 Tax=Cyanophyceae TaxID=3028117 RepID=UPI0016893494|nr:hypothetical protein [Coleofasciculus sp. FACHB-542]MBD2085109.1 hypothetical protein [Coleofasciculus sp. FACHB-542]